MVSETQVIKRIVRKNRGNSRGVLGHLAAIEISREFQREHGGYYWDAQVPNTTVKRLQRRIVKKLQQPFRRKRRGPLRRRASGKHEVRPRP